MKRGEVGVERNPLGGAEVPRRWPKSAALLLWYVHPNHAII
jgi:hypothetical protein